MQTVLCLYLQMRVLVVVLIDLLTEGMMCKASTSKLMCPFYFYSPFSADSILFFLHSYLFFIKFLEVMLINEII